MPVSGYMTADLQPWSFFTEQRWSVFGERQQDVEQTSRVDTRSGYVSDMNIACR